MKQLICCIRIEILKYKRTYALALAVLAPMSISALYTVIFFIKGATIIKAGDDGVLYMFANSLIYATGVLFPLYLILLAVFIHQIEYKSSSLKDLFSFPASRFNTYLSKWTLTFLLLLLSLSLYFLFNVLGAWIVSMKFPDLFMIKGKVISHFALQIFFVFIASLFMTGIHFLLSLRWSEVVVPFGIGIAGFLSAMILVNGWRYVHFHPYALGYLTMMAEKENIKVSTGMISAYSISGFLLLFVAGYFLWARRRIS